MTSEYLNRPKRSEAEMWQDPSSAPAGERLKLRVTDGRETWEPPHVYVLDGPSGQFFPHGLNEPISDTLTVLGWRYAV